MRFHIICEFREDDPMYGVREFGVSDRPRKQTILDFCATINSLGHTCSIFGGINSLIHAYDIKENMSDGIYINLNDGITGTYGRIQAPVILELLGVPYANSDPFVSALLNNKHFTKLVASHYGVTAPKGILVNKDVPRKCIAQQLENIDCPVIVKPNTEGSSVGITQQSVCNTFKEVMNQLTTLSLSFDEVIIEEYIQGYEVTNLLFGNQDRISFCDTIAFELDEKILFYNEVMGANEKTNKLRKNLLAENVLERGLVDKIESISRLLMKSLNIRDLARFDYRIKSNEDIYLLEINSLPRIGRDSDLGFLCAARSIQYEEQIDKYLNTILFRVDQSYFTNVNM